jgi:hypothetical protein
MYLCFFSRESAVFNLLASPFMGERADLVSSGSIVSISIVTYSLKQQNNGDALWQKKEFPSPAHSLRGYVFLYFNPKPAIHLR